MIKDKRKALRRSMRYTAWVVIEGEPHGCSLSDISETGARLNIDNSKEIPDDFVLFLTSNGSAKRKCRAVWRKPHQIGVTFDREPADEDRATLVPKLDAHVESEQQENARTPAAEPTETGILNEPAKSE
ncbi:MAG: PilZ domain-containing protein [Pseudolabrys sp.]